MNKTILVTGGAGYIGSHVCWRLHDAGYTPVVLDNLSTGHEWAVKWGDLVRGDIGDADLVARLLAEHRPRAVLNFAAESHVDRSIHLQAAAARPLSLRMDRLSASLPINGIPAPSTHAHRAWFRGPDHGPSRNHRQ